MALGPRELLERIHRARWPDRAYGWGAGNLSRLVSAARAPRGPTMPRADELEDRIARSPLRLPWASAPEVSVVVPVYGQKSATFACLASLAATPAGRSFEVVVVDDRSPDDTLELLRAVEGIRLVENDVNLGFIGASNAGAAVARAPFLCFLNNDTTVTPGWLGQLVGTFDRFGEAGLVGPRLLFPDGRIQEAGGTIFRDGSGSHFGRNRRPGPSVYEHVRPVDYVSGACAVIPRELFEALGGFDPFFAPAYYEDTDLAFRVRRAGRIVLHQPAARVFHHEGLTHGKDVTRGGKRHQITNRARFFTRWESVLRSEHPVPGRRTADAADRRRGPRLLFVTDRPDHRLRDLAVALAPVARPAYWSGSGLTSGQRAALGAGAIEPLGGIEAPNLETVLRRAPRRFDALLLGLGARRSTLWLERAHSAAPDLPTLVDVDGPATVQSPHLAWGWLVPVTGTDSVARTPPDAVRLAPPETDAAGAWLRGPFADFLRRR